MSKFKVGKIYETRDDQKVLILSNRGQDKSTPLIGGVLDDSGDIANVLYYRKDGSYYHHSEYPLDLRPHKREFFKIERASGELLTGGGFATRYEAIKLLSPGEKVVHFVEVPGNPPRRLYKVETDGEVHGSALNSVLTLGPNEKCVVFEEQK